MSQENVELVREMYEAYLAGDADRALAYCHPDVVVDFTVRGDTTIGEGPEALRENVSAWVAVWDEYSERIDEIHDLGEQVCVIAMQRGRGKGSGLEIETQFAGLYGVRDGMITSVTMYANPKLALEAARRTE